MRTLGSEFPISTAALNLDGTTLDALGYFSKKFLIVVVNVKNEAVRTGLVLGDPDAHNPG
jgi:hypothetical protein